MCGGVVCVCVCNWNHLSTLLDIDIYSIKHNGGKGRRWSQGDVGWWRLTLSLKDDRWFIWHVATSEHCFQTSLKYSDTGANQPGIKQYGSPKQIYFGWELAIRFKIWPVSIDQSGGIKKTPAVVRHWHRGMCHDVLCGVNNPAFFPFAWHILASVLVRP